MALADFRYKLDIRVVFRDIDFYRHVNNAVYITWMETARIDYCKLAFDRPLGAKTNVIMASQSFNYERQAQYDDRLVMGCRTSRLGTKSLDFTYELYRGDERIGHGLSALVAFDYDANTSVPIPDEWRRKIAAYELVAPLQRAAQSR
ncbi:MAG TPA: thioesterase family protein [Candidatus Elarobacter sp.]|jgi:acyl-CoA thioester hydrolase|nr:thioesterase family protein [Candidatus Elarobacter sp.]